MRHFEPTSPGLNQQDEQLICALLRADTKQEAARLSGLSRGTMYRRLKDPDFKAAWRAARRDTFDDALGILEKTSVEAAQALRSALRSENITKESFCVILAATRVLDRAFKAQSAIAVEEELAELRELLATIKAGELPGATPSTMPLASSRRPASRPRRRSGRPSEVRTSPRKVSASSWRRPGSWIAPSRRNRRSRSRKSWPSCVNCWRRSRPASCRRRLLVYRSRRCAWQ
jgi:hypothetical protein